MHDQPPTGTKRPPLGVMRTNSITLATLRVSYLQAAMLPTVPITVLVRCGLASSLQPAANDASTSQRGARSPRSSRMEAMVPDWFWPLARGIPWICGFQIIDTHAYLSVRGWTSCLLWPRPGYSSLAIPAEIIVLLTTAHKMRRGDSNSNAQGIDAHAEQHSGGLRCPDLRASSELRCAPQQDTGTCIISGCLTIESSDSEAAHPHGHPRISHGHGIWHSPRPALRGAT